MDMHKNARLTLILRAEMVKAVLELKEGFTLKRAATRFNVIAKKSAKWVRLFQEAGCLPHHGVHGVEVLLGC